MTGASHANVRLAERIAERLRDVQGIVAVSLGGSLARGAGKPGSDIDLGLYYDPDARPAIETLQALAGSFDDAHREGILTDYGGWGPWIDGGGWLTVGGQRVDLLYRDLARMKHFVGECLAGRTSLHRMGGHPHGFHTHIYLAEIYYGVPLYDPQGVLGTLKAELTPYPPKLKETLVKTFLWQANFDLLIARKSAHRGESYYVAGCSFECASDLIQVVYALNERYFINQKGSLEEASSFPLLPEGFAETISEVMARPGRTPGELEGSLERLQRLTLELETLTKEAS